MLARRHCDSCLLSAYFRIRAAELTFSAAFDLNLAAMLKERQTLTNFLAVKAAENKAISRCGEEPHLSITQPDYHWHLPAALEQFEHVLYCTFLFLDAPSAQ
jgi:hypothetical protein